VVRSTAAATLGRIAPTPLLGPGPGRGPYSTRMRRCVQWRIRPGPGRPAGGGAGGRPDWLRPSWIPTKWSEWAAEALGEIGKRAAPAVRPWPRH